MSETRKTTITAALFAGFAAESTKDGERVRVVYRYCTTADDPHFYMFVNQISDDLLRRAGVDGDATTKFFIVQRPDGQTDVYSGYPVIVQARVNRDVRKGEPIYEHDISDIVGYRPEGVTLQPTDAVICVMKVGWKYGLLFDASRDIAQEQIWAQLGQLYQALQVDRVLANIQERIRVLKRPHIITEGKTDWRHIEAARRALGVDILLGYATDDDSLGDSALLQICERLAKVGPSYTSKIIAIFDRDNPQILAKLKARGDLSTYQSWGNSVYSLALPTPPHREHYKNLSIELLYTDADLLTTDANGKRLFFDNELRTEVVPGSPVRYAPIPAVAAKELDKKVFDGLVEHIVDDNGRQVGLSKARFAELVYGGVNAFGRLDASSFTPIFGIIKDILADDDRQN